MAEETNASEKDGQIEKQQQQQKQPQEKKIIQRNKIMTSKVKPPVNRRTYSYYSDEYKALIHSTLLDGNPNFQRKRRREKGKNYQE